jgi:putative ABC transport system permease protein
MIDNYFKIAIRNLMRHKVFSLLNILGLAVGFAAFIFIFMFVRNELRYDRFYEKADRIYRIAVRASIGDTKIRQTYSSAITFRRLLEDFPEIESGVKFLNWGRVPVIQDDKTFYESRVFSVDSTFFDLFTIPLIHGDRQSVLNKPNTLTVTRSTALKYFGNTDVIGKTLSLELSRNRDKLDFMITGVSDDVPANSHFHYDMLMSSSTFPELLYDQEWTANRFISYLLLRPGTSASELDKKLGEFTRKYMGAEKFDEWVAKGNYWEYYLQPLTSIHLNSDLNGEFEANGNETYVYIFSLVSVFVLLIASINFMNLSTAKSSLRTKEVGIRKVVGSSRARLIVQFLSESVLMSFIALGLALAAVELLLPFYRNFIGRSLEINYFKDYRVIPGLIVLGFAIGIFSGSYPAFFLSSCKPVSIFKGNNNHRKGNLWFRNLLVVMQFSISIFLIIGTLTIFRQFRYFQEKKLGFDREQVLVVKNPSPIGTNINAFKESLRQSGSVVSVSGSNTLPGRHFGNIGFGAEGIDKNFTLNICVCDQDFLNTLKLHLERGRFFSRNFLSDSSAVVLNRKAADLLGWADPLGKKVNNYDKERGNFTVIGVVGDFHYESLHQEIRPMGLFLSGGYFRINEEYISVRLNTSDLSGTMDYIRKTWDKFAPGKPFEYSFLDDDYNSLYANEEQTRKLFTSFTFLAVFIACLGLFGLASFSAQRRTREIGIRKVLGASSPHLILLLVREFLKWVLIANLLAWPVAFYFMNRWLQNFAYRTEISLMSFVAAAFLAFIIALLTVIYQAIRASSVIPVRALRYE